MTTDNKRRDNEPITLGRLLDDAARLAFELMEAIPEDLDIADENRMIEDVSTVPDAIAERMMDLPACTADGVAAKAKAIAWIDRVRLDMAA